MNKNKNRNSQEKTDLARKVAEQSKKASRVYEKIENVILIVGKYFSIFLDRFIFNKKYSKLVSLLLAILVYGVVNYDSMSKLYTTTLKSSRTIENVSVVAKYNSDTFEVSGLPETANVFVSGDATSVTNAMSTSETSVVADLSGLSEGEYNISLKAEGFGSSVTTVVDPSTVTVTLKKKYTQEFNLSYDYINQNKMDAKYSLSEPTFEFTKVNVRASKDTLSSISFVKALIDVSGQTSDFEQDAKLVAYNSNGELVNADIVPSTVHVSVGVSSPSKSVPIIVKVSGDVPNGKAINSITLDQQTVTIYGSEDTLSNIENVSVSLDASSITQDSSIVRPIILPSGVSTSSISQVTMQVTIANGVSKTIDNVAINYINNVNNYKASQATNKTTTSVTVFGTQDNVDKVSASDIFVYFDMKNAEVGLQTFTLNVEQPSDGLVKYTLNETTYEVTIYSDNDEGVKNE